jgi:hypothetical protein
MDRQQYIDKHLHFNIQQAEIERKWRVYEEEQAQIELAMRMSQISSSMVGVSLWEELLYMDLDYMDDELNYVG